MKGYSYNYAFLKQWMKKNKKTKGDILAALGTKNYLSLGSWIDGSVPVPVENMLLICNTFLIPVENFFFFNGETASVFPPPATAEDQVVPTGGWSEEKKGGGQNQRRGTQPLKPVADITPAAGTPWTDKLMLRNEEMKERIQSLQDEIIRLRSELNHSEDSIKERDLRIEDLRVQARTNEKLVMSLTEQNDFMREQVHIAQHKYQSMQEYHGEIVSENSPADRK